MFSRLYGKNQSTLRIIPNVRSSDRKGCPSTVCKSDQTLPSYSSQSIPLLSLDVPKVCGKTCCIRRCCKPHWSPRKQDVRKGYMIIFVQCLIQHSWAVQFHIVACVYDGDGLEISYVSTPYSNDHWYIPHNDKHSYIFNKQHTSLTIDYALQYRSLIGIMIVGNI